MSPHNFISMQTNREEEEEEEEAEEGEDKEKEIMMKIVHFKFRILSIAYINSKVSEVIRSSKYFTDGK